jgi:hypothetical protein
MPFVYDAISSFQIFQVKFRKKFLSVRELLLYPQVIKFHQMHPVRKRLQTTKEIQRLCVCMAQFNCHWVWHYYCAHNCNISARKGTATTPMLCCSDHPAFLKYLAKHWTSAQSALNITFLHFFLYNYLCNIFCSDKHLGSYVRTASE